MCTISSSISNDVSAGVRQQRHVTPAAQPQWTGRPGNQQQQQQQRFTMPRSNAPPMHWPGQGTGSVSTAYSAPQQQQQLWAPGGFSGAGVQYAPAWPQQQEGGVQGRSAGHQNGIFRQNGPAASSGLYSRQRGSSTSSSLHLLALPLAHCKPWHRQGQVVGGRMFSCRNKAQQCLGRMNGSTRAAQVVQSSSGKCLLPPRQPPLVLGLVLCGWWQQEEGWQGAPGQQQGQG